MVVSIPFLLLTQKNFKLYTMPLERSTNVWETLSALYSMVEVSSKNRQVSTKERLDPDPTLRVARHLCLSTRVVVSPLERAGRMCRTQSLSKVGLTNYDQALAN